MQLAESKRHFSLPFHVVKRLDTPKNIYWAIKIGGFLVALLLAGIICTIFRPGTFGLFYQQMFLGCFDPSDTEVLIELLETVGILLLVAFALAPAFKMKFWNIGGEGQILVGCLVTAGISKFMIGQNDTLTIIICLVAALAAGIIWAVIPAIFKAFFGTNETLFTLMMNYIAMGLIAYFINLWVPSGSQVFPLLRNASLPSLFGFDLLFNILVVIVVVALMIVYLKKTKHGYELSVVGESVNTARYVGINVKKVIIRTMILSGALCGLVGFLLVAGHHHTLSTTLADGRGFTGVLIAWLGGFQPGQMIMYAFLVGIFQCGSRHAASTIGMNYTDFSSIITGVFFLVVIATEFFVNYKVKLKGKEEVVKVNKVADPLTVPSYSTEPLPTEDDEPSEVEKAEEPLPVKKPVKKVTKKASKPQKEAQKPTKKEKAAPKKAPVKNKPAAKKSNKEAK